MLLDERLFCQTVTVYRCQDQQLLRMEIPNCHMHLQSTLVPHVTGSRIRKDFTLIVPGQADVMPGDLIYHGIGSPWIHGQSLFPQQSHPWYRLNMCSRCIVAARSTTRRPAACEETGGDPCSIR